MIDLCKKDDHVFYSRETAERAVQHAERLLGAVRACYQERGEAAFFMEGEED
jgi:hypothetical protein